MNKKVLIVILSIIISISSCVLLIYNLCTKNNKTELETEDLRNKNNKLILAYDGGISEPEDSVKWSYEIDLNKRESTRYCSSTGLLRDEKLIKKYGYDKRKTRPLSEDEFNIITQILTEPDNYKDETYSKPRYILYNDNIRLCIPVDNLKANILKSITNNY